MRAEFKAKFEKFYSPRPASLRRKIWIQKIFKNVKKRNSFVNAKLASFVIFDGV